MDYESAQEGTLRAIVAEEGTNARVGDTIGIIGSAEEDISALLEETKSANRTQKKKEEPAGTSPPESSSKKPPESPRQLQGERLVASPLARKIARDRGIPLETLRGSGPGGCIIKRDLEGPVAAEPGAPEPSRFSADGVERREKVSGKRKVIAERLTRSMQQAPHYYEKIQVEMEGLLRARQELNRSTDRNIMLNSFLILFVAESLKKHPPLRSVWQGDEIITYDRIDIGVAVALDDGLITPVVRDCGSRDLLDIDLELGAFIEKARAGKLKPEDYSGSVFTISNLGSRGIEEFTAVINPPGSAILAVGAARKEAVVEENGTIGVKTLSTMTLSSDHRVIDGAVAASFLIDLKRIIEYPVNTMI